LALILWYSVFMIHRLHTPIICSILFLLLLVSCEISGTVRHVPAFNEGGPDISISVIEATGQERLSKKNLLQEKYYVYDLADIAANHALKKYLILVPKPVVVEE